MKSSQNEQNIDSKNDLSQNEKEIYMPRKTSEDYFIGFLFGAILGKFILEYFHTFPKWYHAPLLGGVLVVLYLWKEGKIKRFLRGL